MTGYDGTERLVPGTLRGYRCWRYDSVNHEFHPLHVQLGPWRCPGVTVARCSSEPEFCADEFTEEEMEQLLGPQLHSNWQVPPPVPGCMCGIYATYSLDTYRYHLPRPWEFYDGITNAIVHGTIRASGKIVLGDHGFRAQKAEIEALWGRPARAAARVHELPWFWRKKTFLKEFPPQSLRTILES